MGVALVLATALICFGLCAGIVLCLDRVAVASGMFVLGRFTSVQERSSKLGWASAAELFFHRHVRSCAASASGSRGTSASSALGVLSAELSCFLAAHEQRLRCAAGAFTVVAANLLRVATYHASCRAAMSCLGFSTLHWTSLSALASPAPVLTKSIYLVLGFGPADSSCNSSCVLLIVACGAVLAFMGNRHCPTTWSCRLCSVVVMASLCSESLLAALLGSLAAAWRPSFPPERSPPCNPARASTDSLMSVELMDQRWDVEISRDTVFGGKYVARMDGEDRPEFRDLHDELVIAIRTNGNGACAIHAAFGSWRADREEWYSRSSEVETFSLRGSIPTFLSVVRVSISPGLRRAAPQESPQVSPGAVLL